MLKQLFYIFIGGGLGSILRYGLGIGFNHVFPYGTWAANLLGCFFIGILITLFEKQLLSHSYYLVLAIGFCGGFTTFSSFAAENIKLLQNGHTDLFFLYTAASITAGFLMVWLGFKLPQWI